MSIVYSAGVGLIGISLILIGWELVHKRNPFQLTEEDQDAAHDDLV